MTTEERLAKLKKEINRVKASGASNVSLGYLQSLLDALEASQITVDTSGFDNNLSVADDTVQKALDTIDDFVLGSGEANTASNLGSEGEGLFTAKSGVDLPFKKIKVGLGLRLLSDSEKIIIELGELVAEEATNIESDNFDANWSLIGIAADGFLLDVSDDPDFGTFVLESEDVGNVLTYNVAGLSSETPYYYRVRYYIGSSQSLNSNVIEADTIAGGPASYQYYKFEISAWNDAGYQGAAEIALYDDVDNVGLLGIGNGELNIHGTSGSASSDQADPYPASNASNGIANLTGSSWLNIGTAPTYWQFVFTVAPTNPVLAYSIWSINSAVRSPNSWVLKGSNDGSTWTTLDSRSGETWSSSFEVHNYIIP